MDDLRRLCHIARTNLAAKDGKDQEFLDVSIADTKPYKNNWTKHWPLGRVSKIFHFGTTNAYDAGGDLQTLRAGYKNLLERVKGKLIKFNNQPPLPIRNRLVAYSQTATSLAKKAAK